jgi:DNA-binding NarL/FixJ family response regulator
MARICALAGIDDTGVPLLTAVLTAAGEQRRPIPTALDVRELGHLHPDVMIGDIDHVDVDPMELVRQLRFVLPSCTIAIYSDHTQRSWGLACHLAGANCLLSKQSTRAELSAGLADALATGCFTDPRFDR